jgi:uncharacterized protein
MADRHPFELVGVVHLPALPGAPGSQLPTDAVVERALADIGAMVRGGLSSVLLENFGDVPFTGGSVDPHVPAILAVIGARARLAHPHLVIGLNVLRNDARAALGAAVACGASFVRVNVHTGATWTDQGLVQGDAYGTLRYRKALGATSIRIAADVDVKHGTPAGRADIAELARDARERGLADVLIVTGARTGEPPDRDDVRRVRAAGGAPVWLGSGVTPDRLSDLRRHADGAIVGTWLHRDGRLDAPVDEARVAKLHAAART